MDKVRLNEVRQQLADQLAFENVARAYNGRHGCMCGCNGDYVTAKAEHVSYDAERELNPRKTKVRYTRTMNDPQAMVHFDDDGNVFYVVSETANRVTVVYFKQ